MSFQSRNQPIPNNLYASVAAPRPTLRQRAVLTFALWRQRVEMRRRLAEMDSRSLRDVRLIHQGRSIPIDFYSVLATGALSRTPTEVGVR